MADLNFRKIAKIALVSRLISLIAQCVFNNLIPDYDTSEEHCSTWSNTTHPSSNADIVNYDSFIDKSIVFLIGGNAKWDAVYFLHIVQNGYQYEQNMAFFPLLPLLVHSLKTALKPLELLLNLHQKTSTMLAATMITTAAFTAAAVGLFALTETIFRSKKLAYTATIFFCFNPASVFFSATYSESIFAMTQFWGMCFLEKHGSYLASTFLFSLGAAARSNGMISVGFIGYKLLQELFRDWSKKGKTTNFLVLVFCSLSKGVQLVLWSFIVILPFLGFQYYGFLLFCHSKKNPPWCEHTFPLPYSYIQSHYWNVGFLKYFELKQLPNFLLATPAVVMGVLGIYDYVKSQSWHDILFLGILMPKRSHFPNLFVYAVHLGFLLLFGVTSMHVQVVTRFIASSSPMIYWFAAIWATREKHNKSDMDLRPRTKSKLIYIYFLVYYWLGFLLHCNFYPWT